MEVAMKCFTMVEQFCADIRLAFYRTTIECLSIRFSSLISVLLYSDYIIHQRHLLCLLHIDAGGSGRMHRSVVIASTILHHVIYSSIVINAAKRWRNREGPSTSW